MKARVAAALPLWLTVGFAGAAGTIAFTGVQATRIGCVSATTADLIAVAAVAGLGLGVAALLLVGAVSDFRSVAAGAFALSALALSTYATVAFLLRDSGSCF
jgi:hypothetical protein